MTKAFTERLDETLQEMMYRFDGMNSAHRKDRAKEQILALVADEIDNLMGEIDTMPHYIRSKFAQHVEVTGADYAEMLLADEVKRIIATQRKKLGI